MFIHIFGYRLKCLLRDRQMVFWTLIFPMLLATFFNLAFGKLIDNETFNPVNVAVVTNEAYQQNTDFKQVLQKVSTGEDRIFNVTEATEEEAAALLSSEKISAYILLAPDIQMIVRKTGISQDIVKIFLEQYRQTSSAAANILLTNPQGAAALMEAISQRQSYTREVSMSKASPNTVFNYFYSLLAMAAFYGSFWGLREVTDIQANLSTRAARVNLAPVHKLKAFLYSLTAALLLQYSELLLLLAYLYFGLKIEFGSNIPYILLTSFVGSLTGLTFGAFISAIVKKSEGLKVSILIGITMLGSALSGMMFDQLKYLVSQKAPLLAYINPVSLLTDSFYALYYYDTYGRYWMNIGLLCIFIFLFCTGTYMILRRQKYASL
jgi:ABC-2 type transport system permease protein